MATERLDLRFAVDKQGEISIKQLSRSMGSVNTQARKGNVALGGMSKKLIAVGAAAVGAIGVRAVQSLIEMGAQADAAAAAFENLTDAPVKVLEELKLASKGLLDETFLQQIGSKLTGVTQDAGEMGRVTQLAMKMAAASGKTYKQTLDSLSQALITGETETFKTLGLIIDNTAAMEKFAAANGKTVKELTKAEEVQATFNLALDEGEKRFGAIDTSGLETGLARLTTQLTDMQSELAVTAKDFGNFVADTISDVDRINAAFGGDVTVDLVKSYARVPMLMLDAARNAEEVEEVSARLLAPWEGLLSAATAWNGQMTFGGDLIKKIIGTDRNGIMGAWRWSSRTTGEWQSIRNLLEEAQTTGLSYANTLTAIRQIVANIRNDSAETKANFEAATVVTLREIDAEIKGARERLEAEEKYIKLHGEAQALSARGVENLNRLERQRLDLLNLQVLKLIEGKLVSEEAVDAFGQEAYGALKTGVIGALDSAESRVKSFAAGLAQVAAGIAESLSKIEPKTPTTATSTVARKTPPPEFGDLASRTREIAQAQAQLLSGREAIREQARLTSLEANAQMKREIAQINKIAAARRDARVDVDEDGVKGMVRQSRELAGAKWDVAYATLTQYDAQAKLSAEENMARINAALAKEGLAATAELRGRLTADIYRQADAISALGDGAMDASYQISALSSALGGGKGLDARTAMLVDNLAQVSGSVAGIVKATTGGSKKMHGAIASTISATGQLAAGLTNDVGQAAWLMFAFEAAAAIASGIGLDFVGLAQHSAMAAVWAGLGIAMGVGRGRGGSKGRKGGTVASLGTSTPTTSRAGTISYNVYMGNNNVFADDTPAVGEKLVRHLGAAKFSGVMIPAEMVG